LAKCWGLPRPIIKFHAKKWARELPKIFEFLFNISATAEAIDFKFSMQLGFAKGHHKITTKRKSGRGSELGKLPKILGFFFNVSATAETSDFKFGTQLWFAEGHYKITPRGESGRGPALRELSNNWGFPFNIYAMAESIDFKFGTQSGWPIRPIIKSHK